MPWPSELPRVRDAIRKAGIAGITVRALHEQLGVSVRTIYKHLAELRRLNWLGEDTIQSGSGGRPELIVFDRSLR